MAGEDLEDRHAAAVGFLFQFLEERAFGDLGADD